MGTEMVKFRCTWSSAWGGTAPEWGGFCCELQPDFITQALGKGVGRKKRSWLCLEGGGNGLRCYREHKERKEGGFGGGVFVGALRFALPEARGEEASCSSAGSQRAAGARQGELCAACSGKGISCSKLELKLQDCADGFCWTQEHVYTWLCL